jgi:hypothetical protein
LESGEEKKEKIIKSLEETRDLQAKSVDGIKKAVEGIPYLNESNRLIEKNIEAYRHLPGHHFINFPENASQLIDSNLKNAQYYYGQVRQMDFASTGTSTSAAYSSTVNVVNWLGSTGMNSYGTEVAPAFNVLKASLDDIQATESRRSEIRAMLGKLLRPEHNKFDDILFEYEKVKGDIQNIGSLSILMRTLLEKIKGELKLRLPNQIGVTDSKILPAVAEQLLDPTKSTPTFHTYSVLIGMFQPLMTKLTDTGKWNIRTTVDVDVVLSEFESMIYSLLVPVRSKL